MKSVVLFINGGVYRLMVPYDSEENLRVLLASAVRSKKRWWWQKPQEYLWLPNGSKIPEVVIKSGSLDAYTITDVPPPPPDLQREAIDLMKRAMEEGKEGDEWKKE